MEKNKKWYSSIDDWLSSGNWTSIVLVLVNLGVVILIAYVLLYLPTQYQMKLDNRQQFIWNTFSLIASLWTSYQFAKQVSKREIHSKDQATARSAINRIQELKQKTAFAMRNLESKLNELTIEASTGAGVCDAKIVREKLIDIKHQLDMIALTVDSAVLDWKQILPQDFKAQSEEDANFEAAQERIMQLQHMLAEKDGIEVNLEKEKNERAEVEKLLMELRESKELLEDELKNERQKAVTATQRAPFPIGATSGTASFVYPFNRYTLGAGVPIPSANVQQCNINPSLLIAAYLKEKPYASDEDISTWIKKWKIDLSTEGLEKLLSSPEIKKLRQLS